MSKKLMILSLILMLALVNIVIADDYEHIEVDDDLLEAMEDDCDDGKNYSISTLKKMSEYDGYHTQLYVQLNTHDTYANDGDVFLFKVKVTNVGDYPAVKTMIDLASGIMVFGSVPLIKSRPTASAQPYSLDLASRNSLWDSKGSAVVKPTSSKPFCPAAWIISSRDIINFFLLSYIISWLNNMPNVFRRRLFHG